MPDATLILVCRCASHALLPGEAVAGVTRFLGEHGVSCVIVDDLCGLSADRSPGLARTVHGVRDLTVVACHPRAVAALLAAAGWQVAPDRLHVIDMRRLSGESLYQALPRNGVQAPPIPGASPGDGWLPWFPVVDAARCTRCGQCVSFCLFGVYEAAGDGRPIVANPRQCKNNCPACARICPQAAIMFPKLPESEGPLNGDEITDEAMLKVRARASVQDILGDDIYAALAERRRRAGARRLVRPDHERAERERAACTAGMPGPAQAPASPQES